MAIPKTTPRTILLVGKEHCIMKELVAAGTITPGHLVTITSAGKWAVHGTAGGNPGYKAFAVEADLNGKGIDDNYVANDWAYAWFTQPGVEINALVAAAATAIAVGDYLESAGNGTLRKLASGTPVAQALQAVDNSGGGSSVRIQALVL
jgi:hypothetical protein